MRDAIEAIVRQVVGDRLEKLDELEAEVEELRRLTQSMIRKGKVIEVDETGTLVKVQHGQLTTPFIRWFATSAGATIDYRCPSEGEQVVLLNWGNGFASAQYVALTGMFSDAFPSPSKDPNEILRVYPDGSRVSYHATNNVLLVDVKGKVNVKATGEATVDAKSIHFNGKDGNAVGTCHSCLFYGGPHTDGSSTVTVGN